MKNCPECHSGTAGRNQVVPAAVLVGNLNVGKSTLFRRLCGDQTFDFNFPGSSVSLKAGIIKGTSRQIFLTPGIHSLFSTNEDEAVSRDILLASDSVADIRQIVLVADAKNLKRSLAILLQYSEYGLPILLVVNMIDEAVSRGIEIDFNRLAELLRTEIHQTVAREGLGVKSLAGGLDRAESPPRLVQYPDWLEEYLTRTESLLGANRINPRALGLLLLVEDPTAEQYLANRFGGDILGEILEITAAGRQAEPDTIRVQLANLYNHRADQLVREVQKVEPPTRLSVLTTMGDWCTQLHTGLPIALAVITGMYLFLGRFGATYLVDTINGTLFQGILIPWLTGLLEPIPYPLIRDLFVDPDFGILPTGIFLALGLVLPILFCFYFAFGLLQDSGYLPRLSILLDRIFQKMGLNGKGVIPLVMGFSCVTMALLTTRMLGTPKERNIATFLLLLGMPCAPLIAVMLIILEGLPLTATFTVFGILLLQTFTAGVVLNRILPGGRSPFLMEIPPLRKPKVLQVLRMAGRKSYFFMKEAIPVFIFASCVVFFFDRLGGLEFLEEISHPLVTGLMGLPDKSVQVFIKTMIRRESGAAELEFLSQSYTNLQLVVNLLVMTFLTPCINAIIVLIKERGPKTAATIIGCVFIYAILAGAAVNHVCRLLGITFT